MDTERIARVEAGLRAFAIDRTRLAAKIGVDQAQLSRVLHGTRPGKREWPAIAAVLECDLVWLTTGNGRPPIWSAAPTADEAVQQIAELQTLIKRQASQIAELEIKLALAEAAARARAQGQPSAS
jgi:hypothetical protein